MLVAVVIGVAVAVAVDVFVAVTVGVFIDVLVEVGVVGLVAVGVALFVGVVVAVLVGVVVAVFGGVDVLVGVFVAVFSGVETYSICSKGAAAGNPLYASATRSPVPVMMTTSEFPLDQPGRFTISCTTEPILGVRCPEPASPTIVHPTGDQGTAAVVLVLDDMFPLTETNGEALSLSSPTIVSEVATELTSST